ncbi:MAG: cardiolipin synthase [Muribaculaceae bacterium]|nr:cardiolipin synthase [Muribaculaceae bacterium]
MASTLALISPNTFYTIIFIIYSVTVLGIIGVVISENRNPVKSLAWVTVLLLLPVIGIVLYVFFGRSLKSQKMISRRNKRKLRRRDPIKQVDINSLNLTKESRQQIRLAKSLTGSEYIDNNEVKIFIDGKSKFESLITDLENAEKFINLQYYIFENDNIGNKIKDILIAKAQAGVKVRVIYDHVGCFSVKKSFYKSMVNAGVDAQPFMKVTFPQLATHLNWRNHRKIIIIDGKIGYIGGMNIADRYISGGNHKYWRDTHLKIVGRAVVALQYSFAIDWNFMGKPLLDDVMPPYEQVNSESLAGMQLVTSGPMGTWSAISLVMLKAISNAKKCIYIQTPYFLPTESLLKALQAAALSGVDVKIMIPRKSDSLMLSRASFSYFSECIRAGIKFYLYDSGMLHAKTIIIDDEFTSTGSANFDFRSMEHNFEGNVFIYGENINSKMKEIFVNDLEECSRVNNSQWRHRPIIEKFKESLVRLLSPIL